MSTASASTVSTRLRDALRSTDARAVGELFLVSVLILFLELACIRWFPAHVLFLTFFTNVVLLACFLGMSVGCLAAQQNRNWIRLTPALLGLALLSGYGIEAVMALGAERYVNVGGQVNPQVVYFGTEYNVAALDSFQIPIEVVAGFFFIIIALTFVGPGQELGRSLNRIPDRVLAYTVNIGGSIVGIVSFSIFSYLQLSPFWWFLPVVLALAYYILPRVGDTRPLREWLSPTLLLGVILFAAGAYSGLVIYYRDGEPYRHEFLWSPYYRIDYLQGSKNISVNLIGHQRMHGSDAITPEYAAPHLLYRDARRELNLKPKPFKDILIIGAGSGNDVARALQWGDKDVHIDAVEIDPVIQRLGVLDHPMRPYQNRDHVSVTLDDGRNFLRTSTKQYDLIVYALVDSLVLHSGFSNIRLESYLFTRQAFQDIKARLKPGGTFVTYNYFRQGWVVARLAKGLNEVFQEADDTDSNGNAQVFTWPFQREIDPDSFQGPNSFSGFGIVFAEKKADDDNESYVLRRAFRPLGQPVREYWMKAQAPTPNDTTNGLNTPTNTERLRWLALSPDEKTKAFQEGKPYWWLFQPAKIHDPMSPLRTTTDDWPFLYVREPMMPWLSLRGMGVMGAIALAMIFWFLPRRKTDSSATPAKIGWGFDMRMFFLGAGFMLIETKAVVHMALLFGSTWIVNSVVFFAVLIMILLANVFVIKVKPDKLWPCYLGLLATLALNALIPLDSFLGMDRTVQIIAACALVFAPIAFAGVIFATAFRMTSEPDRAFGANIAGAMLGGLAENTSMLVGFQYLVLIAMGFYALSAIGTALGWANTSQREHPPITPSELP